MKVSSLSVFCLLPALMLLPARLHAQTGNADLQALRMQIEALKTEYQTRIESLEKQLEEVQAQMLRLPEPTAAPVAAAAAVEPVAFARRGLFCCSSFPALTPVQAPLDHVIDVAEFPDRGIECVAGDRQRLVGASEQLSGNRLAIDLQRKLPV